MIAGVAAMLLLFVAAGNRLRDRGVGLTGSCPCRPGAGIISGMGFRGWSSAAVEFYEGLEADNSKSYWQAHRAIYEDQVLRPMEELLAELRPEFGAGKIFRPHRDIRFSADKSPYKTAIAAALAGGGYVQFSADGLAAGCGMYTMAPDQLERYRRAVAEDGSGSELAGIVSGVRRAGIEVSGHGTLKTAPRGFAKDHPRIELLRYKGLVTWKEWPAEETAHATQLVRGFLHASAPLHRWLSARVG